MIPPSHSLRVTVSFPTLEATLVKWTATAAALLVASTALAQTPAPAPEAAPPPAAAAPAPAPAAPPPAAKPPAPTFTFALKGFVSMSAAYQRGAFILSEGQQSLGSATGLGVRDTDSLTFDVRQSRFNFSVKGPQVLFGATPSAVLEIDFMQGFGAGNFGDVSLLNRLRVAYSELNWGNHRLQLGQQNDLIFAMAPTSLSHIAFPLGYFTGNAGWRRPGVFGYHQLALPMDLKVEAAWEVGRGQWADSAACVTTPAPATGCSGVGGAAAGTPGGINLGEATASPAVEGRVTVNWSKFVNGWIATHYNRVDLTGYADGIAPLGTAPTTTHTIAVASYHAGAKVTVPVPVEGMGLTLQATGFTGKNVYPLVANMNTGNAPNTAANFGSFRLGDANNPDIWTTGFWAQAGLNVTKELSLWGLYGQQEIDRKGFVRSFGGAQPAAAGVAYDNRTINAILMYRDGGYGLSAEWINFLTKYAQGIDPTALRVTNTRNSSADQFILTATYFF